MTRTRRGHFARRHDGRAPALIAASLTAIGSLTLGAACVGPTAGAKATPQAAKATPEEKPEGKKDEPQLPGNRKPWKKALADTRLFPGLADLHLRLDQSLLLEVRPDLLERDLALAAHISRGAGTLDLMHGLPVADTRLVRFSRRGDLVVLRAINVFGVAPAGSALAQDVVNNRGDSVLAVFPVISEEPTSKAVLIDLTEFLLSDYADVAKSLEPHYKEGKGPRLDRTRSFVDRVQAFDKNLEIDVTLSFAADVSALETGAETITDGRSIPLGLRFSLFALPENLLRPRLADERVGFFSDTRFDYAAPDGRSPVVSLINRRRLEKQDDAQALSPPKQPIVFYLDRSIPEEWRSVVRKGVLNWNVAFEDAGFKDAIRVEDAPADPSWSAEDLRYSTIRWVTSPDMGYAVGPSHTDPRSGEILDSDILIWSQLTRSAFFDWVLTPEGSPDAAGLLPTTRSACAAGAGAAQQLGVGAMLFGAAAGRPFAPPRELVEEALADLVMHEVGHTLGLRHNFRASASVAAADLHDRGRAARDGLIPSVMDYTPVNVSPDPKRQGDAYAKTVGIYDRFAIEYGYTPIYRQDPGGALARSGTPVADAAAERDGLAKILARAADPRLAYLSDEEVRSTAAVDPYAAVWDLGRDILGWSDERIRLIDRAVSLLPSTVLQPGDSWTLLRPFVTGLVVERAGRLAAIGRFVGGVERSADPVGQPNGRPPLAPVAAATQRRALALVIDRGLRPGAWPLDPALVSRLVAKNEYVFGRSADYPVHRILLAAQGVILATLLDPVRLGRVIDNAALVPKRQAMTLGELFGQLTDAIMAEILAKRPTDIDSFRRNLQRVYVERLVALMLPEGAPTMVASEPGQLWWRTSPVPVAVPPDARSMARWELTRTLTAVRKASRAAGSLVVETRAHLSELDARIARALEAHAVAPR
jgi:hypothetical protein